ncbi:MAG TPA: T9SS type A sorting domain-containing protein, partial [Candidatus Kapabacteria bacterium]|nr:T9SS type A sorting domain-containing protein [Candidatus Kapabacteria bacterium]
GLFIYSIIENKIIDSTFGVGSERIYKSKFTFFEEENKAMTSSGIYLRIINYKNKTIEFDTLLNENIPITDKILYNKEKDYFIAYSYNLLTKVNYKNDTKIIENINIIDTVYPNPSTNEVVIKTNCEYPSIKYKILNINSQVLNESTINNFNNKFILNLSSYFSGTYLIQIFCGKEINTYKIIKEN